MKLRLLFTQFFILISLLSSTAFGANSIELEIGGRTVQVVEEHADRMRRTLVERPDGTRHTVRTYGSRYISFMISMLMTELAYCNIEVNSANSFLGLDIHEETPNCYDEIRQMMLDPGMSLGVLAMAYTNIEVLRNGDKVLKRIFGRMLQRREGNVRATGRVGTLVSLSYTMLNHLAMGAGMIMQTSVASTYNSPYMRHCLEATKSEVRNIRRQGGVVNEQSVATAMDIAQDKEDCRLARKYFWNWEDGTASEIAITLISLGISTAISGTTSAAVGVTGRAVLRFAGLAVLRGSPVGIISSTAGLMAIDASIEMIDRILEPIIRQWYHRRRSQYLLGRSFVRLEQSLDDYDESGTFIREYEREVECVRTRDATRNERRGLKTGTVCAEWRTEPAFGSEVLDRLKKYKQQIEYRRRARVNRYSESHSRWGQKVTGTFSNLHVFKSLVERIFVIRERLRNEVAQGETDSGFLTGLLDSVFRRPLEEEAVAEGQGVFHYDLAGIGVVADPNDLPGADLLASTYNPFAAAQLDRIYEVVNQINAELPDLGPTDRNSSLRRLLANLHDAIHSNDIYQIRIALWGLKSIVNHRYLNRGFYSDNYFDGPILSQEHEHLLRSILTESFSSITNEEALAMAELRRLDTIDFFEDHSQAEDGEIDTQNMRRGALLTENDPLETILLVNKDDEYQHYDQSHWWARTTGRRNRGIFSKSVPSRILSHLGCSDFDHMRFVHNDGRASVLAFPNILKDKSKIDCDPEGWTNTLVNHGDMEPQSSYDPTMSRIRENTDPENDFIFWPEARFPSEDQRVEYVSIDPAFHNVYAYQGKPHIGLLEILIDPNVELRWDSLEEFQSYWNNHAWDQIMNWMVRMKTEYMTSLKNYFDMKPACRPRHLLSLQRPSFCRYGYSLLDPISNAEVQFRLRGLFNEANADYYNAIHLKDAFMEEIRTYAYLVERFTGEADEHRNELIDLIGQMEDMLSHLDISSRDINTSYGNLSPERAEELLTNIGAVNVIGQINFDNYANKYRNISQVLTGRLAEFMLRGITDQALESEEHGLLAASESFAAADVVKFRVYSYLERTLHEIRDTIVRDYINGLKIIDIGDRETGLVNFRDDEN